MRSGISVGYNIRLLPGEEMFRRVTSSMCFISPIDDIIIQTVSAEVLLGHALAQCASRDVFNVNTVRCANILAASRVQTLKYILIEAHDPIRVRGDLIYERER